MRSQSLLFLALLVPSLVCHAQEKSTPGKTPPVTESSPATPPSSAPATAPAAAANSASATPGPALPAGTDADTYVIGPSDTITVAVWKEPTLSASLLVRPDGMISMPLLGDVQAAGLTPLKLADQITLKLKKFIQDPNVSIVINAIHSKVVYLLGEVGRKGPIEMTPNMTLLEAIGGAGGLTDFANTKKIYILRNDGVTHQKIPVHYKEALKGDTALDLVLKPGDTIVVP